MAYMKYWCIKCIIKIERRHSIYILWGLNKYGYNVELWDTSGRIYNGDAWVAKWRGYYLTFIYILHMYIAMKYYSTVNSTVNGARSYTIDYAVIIT